MKLDPMSVFVAGFLTLLVPTGTYATEPCSPGPVFGCVQDHFDALEQRIAELERLLRNFTLEDVDPNLFDSLGNPEETVRITGANLQVVNDLAATGTANGLGNVIIGYNELRPGLPEPPDNDRSGSHVLVVGMEHNYAAFGGIVVGRTNEISDPFATVSGGFGNTASAFGASVSGGRSNEASGFATAVSGGIGNTARGSSATVSGGSGNTASAIAASVSGGRLNEASASFASVSGGDQNTASGSRASVSGGNGRIASGTDDWRAGTLFEDN